MICQLIFGHLDGESFALEFHLCLDELGLTALSYLRGI